MFKKISGFVSNKILAVIVAGLARLVYEYFANVYSEEVGIIFVGGFLGAAFLGYDYEIIKTEIIGNWKANSLEDVKKIEDGTFAKYAIGALIFSIVYQLVGLQFFNAMDWYDINSLFFSIICALGPVVWLLLIVLVRPLLAYKVAAKGGQRTKLLIAVIIGILIVVLVSYVKANILQ